MYNVRNMDWMLKSMSMHTNNNKGDNQLWLCYIIMFFFRDSIPTWIMVAITNLNRSVCVCNLLLFFNHLKIEYGLPLPTWIEVFTVAICCCFLITPKIKFEHTHGFHLGALMVAHTRCFCVVVSWYTHGLHMGWIWVLLRVVHGMNLGASTSYHIVEYSAYYQASIWVVFGLWSWLKIRMNLDSNYWILVD